MYLSQPDILWIPARKWIQKLQCVTYYQCKKILLHHSETRSQASQCECSYFWVVFLTDKKTNILMNKPARFLFFFLLSSLLMLYRMYINYLCNFTHERKLHEKTWTHWASSVLETLKVRSVQYTHWTWAPICHTYKVQEIFKLYPCALQHANVEHCTNSLNSVFQLTDVGHWSLVSIVFYIFS